MRLHEISTGDHPDYEELKKRLLTPGVIEVANASYVRGKISLGDIERVKAGKIFRTYARSEERTEWRFEYFTEMDGQPLKAILKVDGGEYVLSPGQSFSTNY